MPGKNLILEDAPGPSPWYFGPHQPNVPGFLWRRAGESDATAGALVLSGELGPVLILDFQNYIRILDSDALLLWHQQYVNSGPTQPVVLRVFRLSSLSPLEGQIEELCRNMRSHKRAFIASAAPVRELAIPTTTVNHVLHVALPEELGEIDELLILCHSSAIAEPQAGGGNLALMIVRPKEGSVELHPQDWFNNADIDYGYQWVTRVARDLATGKIHGEGIRIGPFVLDHTLRQLA